MEEVPETQEELMPKPTKGKTKKIEKRANPKLWTVEKEVALANAWITVSEDCVTGNSQRRGICLRLFIYLYSYAYIFTLIYMFTLIFMYKLYV